MEKGLIYIGRGLIYIWRAGLYFVRVFTMSEKRGFTRKIRGSVMEWSKGQGRGLEAKPLELLKILGWAGGLFAGLWARGRYRPCPL